MQVVGNPVVPLTNFKKDDRDTLVDLIKKHYAHEDGDAQNKILNFLEQCVKQKMLRSASLSVIQRGLQSSKDISEFTAKNILPCSLMLSVPPKVKCSAPHSLFNSIFFNSQLAITRRYEMCHRIGLKRVYNLFLFASLNNIPIKTKVIGQTLVVIWKLESKPKRIFRKFLELKLINAKNILHSILQFNYEKDVRVLEKKMKDLEKPLPPGTKRFTKLKVARKKKKSKNRQKALSEFAFDTTHGFTLHMSGSYVHAIIEWVRAIIPRDLIHEALHIYYADQTVMSKKLKIWKTLCKEIHCSQYDFLLDWYQSYIFTPERKNHFHLVQSLLENDCYYLNLYNIPISWFPKNIAQDQKKILSEWALKKNPIGVVLQNYEGLSTASQRLETIQRRLEREPLDLDYITLFKVLQEQTAIHHMKETSVTESICKKLNELFEAKRPNLTNLETLNVALYSDNTNNTVLISSLFASLLVEKIATLEFQISSSLVNNSDIPAGVPVFSALSSFIAKNTSHQLPIKNYAAQFVADLYQKCIKIDSFILVVNSNEGLYEGLSFSEWFYKYYHEVHPAHLIIVSFIKTDLYMVGRLNSWDLYPHVIYLTPPSNRAKRFNDKIIDYSKVNGVFGSLLSTKLNLATLPISVTVPRPNEEMKKDTQEIYFNFNGDQDHDILEVDELFSFLDWYSKMSI